MRRPRVSWLLFRDGLSILLAAGIAGTLLFTWWESASGSTSAQRLAALESELQAARREQPEGGVAASRRRLAALEADLARLQQAPAQSPLLSRQEMQRWLDQNSAAREREAAGTPSRLVLGLLAVLAVALLVLTLSRLPERLRSGH